MTLTVKNFPDSNNPGKPGAPSQNSGNNAGESPRRNPVCLEVGVTIRSLPTEAGGLTQPIREEGRTVIVFDNGAVLRSANNLPVGQTVILSNPNGRDVVCRVVGGRNLPGVKGYVEVEFIEPVKDFWGIHRDVDNVPVPAPPVITPPPREATVPPPQPALRAAPTLQMPSKSASASSGSGPTFEDIPGLLSMPAPAPTRESKLQAVRRGPEKITRDDSDYNLSEIARPTSVANWRPPDSETSREKRVIAATTEASSMSLPSSASAPSRDFMSKGLLAYEQPGSSSASNSRMPFILGATALVLAIVGGLVFFLRDRGAPVSVAKTTPVTQPGTPELPAAKSVSAPVPTPRQELTQAATPTVAQGQAEPVAVEQRQPLAALAPVPAIVTSPVTTDTRLGARNVPRLEKNATAARLPEVSSSRRSAIPNLKIGAPSAPNQNPSSLNDGAAPLNEVASTEAAGGTPPAALLTSTGRTSNPPAPPPSAPAPIAAPKVLSSPKLVSSPRPVYPATARQSSIQGSVTVAANIDENGKVASATALNGPLLLRQAAVDAVKQWKYSPGLLDGKPVPSQVTVGVEFRLN
ncbi:MAG TPA: TonB family protein [Candidatus Acidoferrales bacterium]|nr:TonB family protein [Candidatus Acidoferrales bacterium]